jgi:hypothetical protein
MYMQDRLNLIMLKTPSSVETEGGVMEIRPGCDGHYKLRDQIAMLPTPRAEKHSPQSREDFTPNLAARINMLPTPNFTGGRTAPDTHKKERRQMGGKCGGDDLATTVGTSRGLKLQPAFVEWMMGYPLGFTHVESPASKPSVTPLSRKSPTKSSRESQG